MSYQSAYIVAARRTALGRVGGLHRRRRIEELAAPVLAAALADAGLERTRVESILIGNATAGSNPARLIALAAGCPEGIPALTLDRQCASGLDAVLWGVRQVVLGEARVVLAGGAEALSTAPWRIVKPRTVYQLPRFEGASAATSELEAGMAMGAGCEQLAAELELSRDALDAYALKSHIRAFLAHEAKRFVGEIVPLRIAAEEARDESLDGDVTIEDLAELAPFGDPESPLTPGNCALPHDGAAAAVIVAESVWKELGKPAALRLVASAARGVGPDDEGRAPLEAMRAMLAAMGAAAPKSLGLVEMGEASAAQAIALSQELGVAEDALNADGGAVARGLPLGASGAVLVARLFTRMARARKADSPKLGIAVQGARGGLGLAAAFEAA